jgi:hypothetical protein
MAAEALETQSELISLADEQATRKVLAIRFSASGKSSIILRDCDHRRMNVIA